MSLTIRLRRDLRAWHLKRLRRDIAWARESFGKHVKGLAAEIARLRRERIAKPINADRIVFVVTAAGALPFLIIDIARKFA